MEQNQIIAAITKSLELADAYGKAGRSKEMEQICRQLLAAFPDCAEAWNRLGILMAERGNGLQALACLERAIRLAPREPSFHANLGEIMRRAGLADIALQHCTRAVELGPNYMIAHLNLGYALLDLGQADKALPHFELVHTRDKNNLQAWFGLGLSYAKLKQAETAIGILSGFAIQMPGDVRPWVLLANLRLSVNDVEGSLADAQQAYKLQPALPDAINALSDVLRYAGRIAEAETLLRNSLVSLPGNAALLYRLALCRLELGDFSEGFKLYESRLNVEAPNPINYPILPMPAWNGEDLRGKRLLVVTEQGYGDHIQFCRFIGPLADHGVEIIQSVSPPLQALMLSQPGCASVLTQIDQARASACDYWTFVCSLPYRLGIDANELTANAPYLFANPAKRDIWRQRLARLGASRRVGIVWAGRPDHQNDRQRSIPFEKLAPLASVADVAWISLQKGLNMPEIAKQKTALQLESFAEDIADFDDSAALMAELDLLITVDTSTAHLAGALGCPVWTLLPRHAEWRWALAEETTPWYPSMRLFRQTMRDDWDGVMRRIIDELNIYLRS